jgi:putative intracellular protease/amidase
VEVSFKMNSIKHAVMGLFFAMLFANSGVSAAPAKIGIMVFDGFLTSDVTVPIEVFGAAAKKEQVASEEGLRLVADITIYDEVALDVFIVPSAYEMDALLQDEKLIDYIRKQTQSVSWLASNCSGAFLLAAAGVLDGKKATTWAGGKVDYKRRTQK